MIERDGSIDHEGLADGASDGPIEVEGMIDTEGEPDLISEG